jgi:hypothetical protein
MSNKQEVASPIDCALNTRCKRTPSSVPFILPIDGCYRLTADERCWRIEKGRRHGDWRPCEYHTTIETALNSLARRLVRMSEVRTLADALAVVDHVSRKLTLALAPRFTVQRK